MNTKLRFVLIRMNTDAHQSFAELFVRHQNEVFRYIASLVPHRADAEELFQQTSLTLWKRWQDYDGEQPFVPWACGIAHNHLRNFLRSINRQSKPIYLADDVLEQLGQTRLAVTDALAERRTALKDCLGKLSDTQRELVEQRYGSGLTVKALADDSGQSAAALYKTLERIRRALFLCINRRLAPEVSHDPTTA